MNRREANGGERSTQGPSPSPRPSPGCPDGHCLLPFQPCLQAGQPSLTERRRKSSRQGLQLRGRSRATYPEASALTTSAQAHYDAGRGYSDHFLAPPPSSHCVFGCTALRMGTLFLLLLRSLQLMKIGTKQNLR